MRAESPPESSTIRVRATLLLAATLTLGIVSRRVRLGWAPWDKSLGDALYAVAMYLGIAFLFPRSDPRWRALIAFAICFAIELFQITGIPIALAESRPWVHWVLGSAFGWEDVACYAAGIAAIALMTPRLVAAR